MNNSIDDLIGAAHIAGATAKAMTALVEKQLYSTHSMEACLAIWRAEAGDESDKLSQALMLDIVNRVEIALTGHIVEFEKKKEK